MSLLYSLLISLIILTIIITHILFIIINNLLIILNKPNLKGKKIAKLTNKKISYVCLILDIIIIIFFLIMLIWGIYNLNNKEDLVVIIFGSLFNIDLNLKDIIREIRYSYVTNKGIYFKKSFYKWNKILQYKWINSDTVEFELKGFGKPIYEKLTIDIDKKQQLNKLLEQSL